jgi:lipopolysaccharide export system protein LptA
MSKIGIISLFVSVLILAHSPVSANDQTVITSERMEMQGTLEKNYFYFRKDVKVVGTNLELFCNELTVIALRKSGENETVGEIGAIESIVAIGDVVVNQAGRSAYAGRVEVNPRDGTVVLKDSPRVVDNNVEVSGYQFVLYKGEKRFESIPDPNAPKDKPSRSVVRLGALPDLGFDQTEEEVTIEEKLMEPIADDPLQEETDPDVTP